MNRIKHPSAAFVSLGCAKNLVDTEHMMGVLRSRGIELVSSGEKADVVVVNTCAFIREAREEAAEAIREACTRKKAGLCGAVVVAGCLPQRCRLTIRTAFPGVDGFLGLDALDRVGDMVRKLTGGQRRAFDVPAGARELFEPLRPRILLTGGTCAYVKIAEGCDHRCAFCAVPRIRGRYRSRPMGGILREIAHLLERGVREIDLISQDTMSYGRDLRDGTDLPALLRAIGRIGGRFWVRILYGHPAGISDRLLKSMGDVPQVCRYLDIPIQHSHPAVLRAMGRQKSIPAIGNLAARLRRALPGLALRTTCLVGHPGETAAHFDHLLDYVRGAEFDHLGAFVYSPEEGTRAFAMRGRVEPRTAAERRERLLATQRDIVARKSKELVGLTEEVLIERPVKGGRGSWIGRSSRHAPEVDGEIRVSGLAGRDLRGQWVAARLLAPRAVYDMDAVAVRGGETRTHGGRGASRKESAG
jgi:ribosomal protein S12 methylthiotransferase